MPRIRNYILHLVGIVSLLLTLWLTCRWILPDNLVIFIANGRCVAASNLGDSADSIKAMATLLTQVGNVRHWKVLGIEYVRDDWTNDAFQLFAVPLPYFIVITGAVTIVWFRRIQLNRRSRQGRCRNCNYDLRATAGRCPECGTVPSSV